jgi:arylsulfatase A-like enzyme
MDVTATMLEAAGVPVPMSMDSRSLLPLCDANSDADWPAELICEHNGHGEDILQRIIIHERFKYVAALYDGDELYDLAKDPYELHNLVDDAEYRETKADLRRRIIAHIERSNDTRASQLTFSLKQGF